MKRKFAVPGVGSETPLELAAPAILLSKAAPLFDLEEAAASGADMDAVHDMRVASRRLREAMRLLAPLYGKRRFRSWYRRVRCITRVLGPVRDSDVFIDAFSRLASDLGEGGRRCVAFMVGYRMGQRVRELEVLNAELAKLDLVRARAEFTEMARSVAAADETSRPLVSFAHEEVWKRADVVFAAQPAALTEENVTEQHELRIDYKRLRYAVESFAPCYEESFEELHVTLTAFQDALGDLHDTHVFLEMLSEPARVAMARVVGVSDEGIAEVVAVLQSMARAHFERFVTLAREHPSEVLGPALLEPLVEHRSTRPAEGLQEVRGGRDVKR